MNNEIQDTNKKKKMTKNAKELEMNKTRKKNNLL